MNAHMKMNCTFSISNIFYLYSCFTFARIFFIYFRFSPNFGYALDFILRMHLNFWFVSINIIFRLTFHFEHTNAVSTTANSVNSQLSKLINVDLVFGIWLPFDDEKRRTATTTADPFILCIYCYTIFYCKIIRVSSYVIACCCLIVVIISQANRRVVVAFFCFNFRKNIKTTNHTIHNDDSIY